MKDLDKLDEKAREVVVEFQERMTDSGRCNQCINPWFDGLCSCGKWSENDEEGSKIAKMVIDALYK